MTRILTPIDPTAPESRETWLDTWMDHTGLTKATWLSGAVWACEGCGCMFMPDIDDVAYLNRYEYAGGNCENCTCHLTPRYIPIGAGTVCWFDEGQWGEWLCGMPQGHHYVSCTKCDKSAVAFLNLPYEDPKLKKFNGPEWRCRVHLGVPVPTVMFSEFTASKEEPQAFKEARELLESVLALM